MVMLKSIFTACWLHRPRLAHGFWSLLLLVLLTPALHAQNVPEPRRETLLNGLRVVLWPRNGDAKVLLKLRLHSGAAFDLAGKSGTLALLGDSLFPDATAREFIEKDLSGRLTVTTTHDALDITLNGDADGFEEMVNLLRSALTNPTPEPERLNALRDARVKLLSAQPPSADDLALARFFGTFPYGRPDAGRPAELAQVDRNDVIFLRERFLNPNNATLVVAGGFAPDRAYRVLRQLLGNWRKSDAVIGSTFRQPNTPDDRVLLVNQPAANDAEVRLILRGVARNDRDYFTLALLTNIAQARWQAALPELPPGRLTVTQAARTLPGYWLMRGTVRPEDVPQAVQAAQKTLDALAAEGPTPDELSRARATLLAHLTRQTADVEGLTDLWLDADTYRLPAFTEQLRTLNAVTPADAKRTAFRLFRAVPLALVIAGPSDSLQPELEKTAKVEIYGASPTQPATPKPTPSALTKPPAIRP